MWWESANNVHGRSNNPYDVNRIVGGSSGGEGCAQAAACSAFGNNLVFVNVKTQSKYVKVLEKLIF